MAIYIGMTYIDIINRAEIIAQENGFDLNRNKSANFFDEALFQVSKDILEYQSIASQTWPTGSPPSLNVTTENWLHVETLYGDSTPLVYIPYNVYREMFLGDNSLKVSGDFNYYWSRVGDTIYIEPDVTQFTNLIVEQSVLNTKYELDGSTDATVPGLLYQYRMLVCYKIPELIFDGIFTVMYKDKLRRAKSFRNKKTAVGHVQWWDPFAGTDFNRVGSGWPGKISND